MLEITRDMKKVESKITQYWEQKRIVCKFSYLDYQLGKSVARKGLEDKMNFEKEVYLILEKKFPKWEITSIYDIEIFNDTVRIEFRYENEGEYHDVVILPYKEM